MEDAIWQKQLFLLSSQILDRLRKVVGSGAIEDLEFRIAIPRRQPQRAPARETVAVFDEAESIQDPVLKKLYRLSRKKATA